MSPSNAIDGSLTGTWVLSKRAVEALPLLPLPTRW